MSQAMPTPHRKTRSTGRLIEAIALHIFFIAVAIFFLAPFAWLFLAAIDARAQPFIRWPESPTLSTFVHIFEDLNFATYLKNSAIVAISTMILTTFTVSLAGYSLSRIDFRRKDWISYTILLLQTLPLSATMVPIYSLARQLEIRDTYHGLILISVALDLPFLTWLMKGFFDSVPRSLEEAAWIDGRSRLRAWFEIVLPIAKPGLAVAAGLSFLGAWAEVMMVLILIDDPEKSTVPLAFYQAVINRGGYLEVRYDVVAAMGVLYVIPVLALFFATRRMMVNGIMGTTKGI